MAELTSEQKKAFVADYRRAAKPMGLYRVLNTANGRFVVGTATDTRARLNRYVMGLRTGTERNKALQADYTAAGGEGFVFEVLEELEPRDTPGYDPTDDLRTLEAMWWEASGADRGLMY